MSESTDRFHNNLTLFYNATKIPIHIFSRTTEIVFREPHISAASFSEDTVKRCQRAVDNHSHNPTEPLLYTSETCFLALVRLNDDATVMFGPTCPQNVTYRDFYNSNKFNFIVKDILGLYRITQLSPNISLNQFISNIALYIKLEFNDDLNKEDFINRQFTSHSSEIPIKKTNYYSAQYNALEQTNEFGKNILYHLSNGNLEEIHNLYDNTSLFDTLEYTYTSVTDLHKFFFMYAVLCYTRILEVGVDIRKAFPTLDTYISRIPYVSDIRQVKELCRNLTNDFCKQVIPLKKLVSDSPIVTKCLQYIHKNINNKITINDLMKHCNVSQRTIVRHFAEYHSTSATDYIITCKLKEAAFLLQHSDFSITEISNQLAFSSQSHFTTAFKKLYKYTPLQYRNKSR